MLRTRGSRRSFERKGGNPCDCKPLQALLIKWIEHLQPRRCQQPQNFSASVGQRTLSSKSAPQAPAASQISCSGGVGVIGHTGRKAGTRFDAQLMPERLEFLDCSGSRGNARLPSHRLAGYTYQHCLSSHWFFIFFMRRTIVAQPATYGRCRQSSHRTGHDRCRCKPNMTTDVCVFFSTHRKQAAHEECTAACGITRAPSQLPRLALTASKPTHTLIPLRRIAC